MGSKHEAGHHEIARQGFEESAEAFDRMGFARLALDLLRPPHETIALCSSHHLRVESGRQWGKKSAWAIVMIPPRASRRAIAYALSTLVSDAPPYALDVLLREAS